MTKKAKILLIYTGGTIGMVRDYDSGALSAFDFEKVVENIPELQHLNCSIASVAFRKPIDSSNMDLKHWKALAGIIETHYQDHDGFVILHGSDTMSYTGSALSYMLENLSKPVILTGSQLPIGDLRTDAKENLITSIQLAATSDGDAPLIQEVGLYFEYKLYRANRTTKINAEHFEAFDSLNYPPLAESGVHLKVSREYLLRPEEGAFAVQKELDNRVGILTLFPGISREFVRAVLNTDGLRALVIETYGSGNAPTQSWLLEEFGNAIDKGIHLVNVTQCSGGSVLMGRYETSKKLQQLGIINGKDITTEAAITKLMYLLSKGLSDAEFRSVFETPIRGEMS